MGCRRASIFVATVKDGTEQEDKVFNLPRELRMGRIIQQNRALRYKR